MDEPTLFSLMVDLHREGERQGAGSDDETTRALDLTRLDSNAQLNVADIGCGTGAATMVLASKLPHARITEQKFRRIKGHRHLPQLLRALDAMTLDKQAQTA